MLVTLTLAMSLAAGPSLGPEASYDGCTAEDFEAAAWLSGEWAVVHPDAYLAFGEVRLSPVWGGCAFLELQTGVPEAISPLGEGAGLLRFDPLSGFWSYSFAGDSVAMQADGRPGPGEALVLEGRLDFINGGSSRPAQVSWRAMADGAIEHRILMLDTDNGEFTPWQTVHLRPLATTPRPRTPDHWSDEG